MSERKSELGLLLISIIWGTAFVVSNTSLKYFSAMEVIVLRFLLAAIFLFLIYHKRILKINKSEIYSGIWLGCCIYFAFIFQNTGMPLTTPAKSAFICGANVIIVPFIGFFLYKRKLIFLEVMSGIISLIGIGFISLNKNFSVNTGDLLSLLSAFGFAFQIFYTGEFSKKKLDIINLSFVEFVTTVIIGIIFLLIFKKTPPRAIPFSQAIIAVLYLSIFSTSLGFVVQMLCQKNISETKSAVIMSTISIFGAIASYIFTKERLSNQALFGCILIFTAVLVSNLKTKKLANK